MRCCASVSERVVRALAILALTLVALRGEADDGTIRYAEIIAGEDGYVVNADIEFELNPRLTELVSRGVSLHFVAEFQIERPRWYWSDETVLQRRLSYRISYHSITRSYRLSIGSLHQSFDSLDAALRTMQRVRNWRIVELDGLEPGVSYNASLRMRHDTSLLPRPFLVTAIGRSEWAIGTDWQRWTFLAGGSR